MLIYGNLKKTKPLYFFQKICYNNYRKNGKGGQKIMDLLLMRALLIIAKYCAQCGNCKQCLIRVFCGK